MSSEQLRSYMRLSRKYGHFLIIAGLLGLNIFIWQGEFTFAEIATLKIAFLDIGQGDSIFIEAPNGNQMLIDGGSGSSVLSRLGEVMPLGDRSINVLIETHPDKDHSGGLIDVLHSYEVDNFLEPGVPSDTENYKELKRVLAEKNIPVILARRGMDIVLDENRGVHLFILFPDTDVSNFKNTNDASIVARLSYASTSVLLTGDAPLKTEQHLVNMDGARLASDILKVGHHGSRTSSGELFLRAVAPHYAVISVGKKNRYGHPHQEVLSLLSSVGIDTLRTDEQGTIIFESDGYNLVRK